MIKEEAIERVRSRFDKWALDNEDLTALQVLGLVDAESEDERIRKFIAETVFRYYGDSQEYLDVLAYLEKQKEQKPVTREKHFVSKPNNSVEILKQYLTRATSEEENCPYSWKELADAIRDGIKALEEQKPAEWSEEDKQKLNRIYEILGYAADDKGFLTSKRIIGDKEAIELQDFLKSLCPSNDCSDYAKYLEGYIWGRNDAENKLLEQFGALVTPEDELHIKPRWKPSEEQMEALQNVYEYFSTSTPTLVKISDTLRRLYNDLKKL